MGKVPRKNAFGMQKFKYFLYDFGQEFALRVSGRQRS